MILLFLGCGSVGALPSDSAAADSDSGPVDADCSNEADARVGGSGVDTVPELRWSAPEGVAAWAEFDNGDGLTRSSRVGSTGPERGALLLGVLPDAPYTWRVFLADADGTRCVGAGTGTNGALPAGVPASEGTATSGAVDGFTAAPILVAGVTDEQWMMIFDGQARVIWANPVKGVNGTIFSTEFEQGQDALLFLVQTTSADLDGSIQRLSFNGQQAVVAKAPGLHTDFTQIGDGRYAGLTWELRDIGGDRVLGDHVVTIDNGVATTVWNAFDEEPYIPSDTWEAGFYVPDPTALDWSHVNSISWDEASDDLMITGAGYDMVARLSASTGDTRWLFANGIGDYPDTATVSLYPHGASILPDGDVLLFNRGDFLNDPLHTCSWVSEVHVDTAATTVTERSRLTGETCLLTSFLGNAERIADDVTFVDWTSAGRIDQLAADGTSLWNVSLSAGRAFGTADFRAAGE